MKLVSAKMGWSLFSMHLEVTRRCNARCSFCDYWKTSAREREHELKDYAPIVRKFKPLSLTITGGEPLLRTDLETLIRTIVANNGFLYINCISNGVAMTPERARALWESGLSQLSLSLDFPDERHDKQRGVKGLWTHIKELAVALPRVGIDNLVFNTVIMHDNLDVIPHLITFAHQHGWKVSLSTYNPYKNRNFSHRLDPPMVRRVEELVAHLLTLKRRYRNITNSDFYLKTIPRYVADGGVNGCLAGKKWFHVSPDGRIRRCAEKEWLGDWRDVRIADIPRTPCTECWYACRGEAEAPLGVRRIVELNR